MEFQDQFKHLWEEAKKQKLVDRMKKQEEAKQSHKQLKHRWYEANKERILNKARECREADRNHPCACGCGELAIKRYKHGHIGRGRRYFRQGLVSDIENVLLSNSQS